MSFIRSKFLPIRTRLFSRYQAFWLISPSLFFLICFFVLPTLIFFLYSFLTSRYYRVQWVVSLENYARAFSTPAYLDAILNSLGIGLTAAVVTVLLGYPFAYFISFRIKRGRNLVLFLVVASLLGSYLVRVYAWKTILGRQGVINSFLLMLGVIEEPLLFLLFSRLAVIITLVQIFLPFAILPIMASLQNVPYELIEAARDLGCKPMQAFRRVTLPMSITGVVLAFGYTFFLASADFITPQLVGGTRGGMIGVSITNQFIKVGNLSLGAALSFELLIFLVAIYIGIQLIVRVFNLVPKEKMDQ
ncbi:MAG: ABC transporter permease [Anaerolineales bacterium]|nr:ABC transporter permease [Anaerolineales bacterium]